MTHVHDGDIMWEFQISFFPPKISIFKFSISIYIYILYKCKAATQKQDLCLSGNYMKAGNYMKSFTFLQNIFYILIDNLISREL